LASRDWSSFSRCWRVFVGGIGDPCGKGTGAVSGTNRSFNLPRAEACPCSTREKRTPSPGPGGEGCLRRLDGSGAAVGRVEPELDCGLKEFIGRQHVSFVAKALLSPDGHVNVSPRGWYGLHPGAEGGDLPGPDWQRGRDGGPVAGEWPCHPGAGAEPAGEGTGGYAREGDGKQSAHPSCGTPPEQAGPPVSPHWQASRAPYTKSPGFRRFLRHDSTRKGSPGWAEASVYWGFSHKVAPWPAAPPAGCPDNRGRPSNCRGISR
jgi:hypothetical protein